MLESQSKLMYYPTDIHEIYRMLGIIGRISMSIEARDEVLELIGKETYLKILDSSINSYSYNFAVNLYDYFLERKQYDMLHKYFELSVGFSHNQTITVFDPFAGEAVWLEMIKGAIPRDHINSANIHLIANELEQNRYNTIKKKGVVDEYYNKAFEELSEIPKKSISLLLFNPPYGDTNGKRNVLHYLEMIIEEQLIYNANITKENGKMVLVVRKDDLLESLPLLTKYFNVDKKRIYKVNTNEYNKYKQYVVYASARNKPRDDKNVNGALSHQKEIQEITEIINSNPEFNNSMYSTFSMRPPAVPYKQLKENHRILKDENIELSHSSGDNWEWIKELTKLKDTESFQINKPTPLKIGEIANIIASGMINGEMRLNNGAGYHIVAGGTKEQLQQEIIQEKNQKGEIENKTKTLLYTQPYLNILINDNGKVKIKELQGGTELE